MQGLEYESGRYRLTHKLTEEPYNVTTFLYLFLQKQEEIDLNKWERLLGASFFRAKHKLSEKYGVSKEKEIEETIRLLEMDLTEMLSERDVYLRTFRYALDVVNNRLKGKIPDVEECIENIKNVIKEINNLIMEKNIVDRKAQLESKCAYYFYWLVGFYISRHRGLERQQILYHIYPLVKKVLNGSEDIRVHIDALTDEQSARLLKNLFDICQSEKINLKKALNIFTASV